MDKMYKVKLGDIVKVVPSGALKWYIQAGWKVLGDVNATNSKKTTSK